MDQTSLPTNMPIQGGGAGTGTAGLGSIYQILQSMLVTLNAINTTMGKVWPQATGTATSASTSGTVTLPSHATGYLQEYSPSLGKTVLVAYYLEN